MSVEEVEERRLVLDAARYGRVNEFAALDVCLEEPVLQVVGEPVDKCASGSAIALAEGVGHIHLGDRSRTKRDFL